MAGTRSIVDIPAWYVEPTFGARFAAAILDGLILLVVPLAVDVVFLRDGGFAIWVVPVLSAIYTIGAVALTGQTIGKRLFGLRIVDLETAERPSLPAAAVRWFVPVAASLVDLLLVPQVFDVPTPVLWLLPLVPLVVYWGIASPPLHRGLHDRAAGTVVTAEPPSGER